MNNEWKSKWEHKRDKQIKMGLEVVNSKMKTVLRELRATLNIVPLTIYKDASNRSKSIIKSSNNTEVQKKVTHKDCRNKILKPKNILSANSSKQKSNSSIHMYKSNRKTSSLYFNNDRIQRDVNSAEFNNYYPQLYNSVVPYNSNGEMIMIPEVATKNFPLSKNPKINNLRSVLSQLKTAVWTAIRQQKTFTVCGSYNSIRNSLIQRGWVEKMRFKNGNTLAHLHVTEIADLLNRWRDTRNSSFKRVIMSKLLNNHQVDFYWDAFGDAYQVNDDKIKFTFINRLKNGASSYVNKSGLSNSINEAHWFCDSDNFSLHHPRSYSVTNPDDFKIFEDDFKYTAAIAVLKWTVNRNKDFNKKLLGNEGRVPLHTFYFACHQLEKYVQIRQHQDLDREIDIAADREWEEFLNNYYKLVHTNDIFKKPTKTVVESELTERAQHILSDVQALWPDYAIDGLKNIWILKPTNSCRGRGIFLCRSLFLIKERVLHPHGRKYIIQKYIERPHLIHNTKFDMRQWFLVSSTEPLTVWIYKDSYIRFSSQLFNLQDFSESIHLTNNAIQCKYKNAPRNTSLPECNMWDVDQFRRYLKTIGQANAFDEIIYPGMKQCITAALLINRDDLSRRKNSYELFGSDFLVDETFHPWLLEINCRPALYASTPITCRMCPQVLEDVIKVMVDYRQNPSGNTGKFELLYKDNEFTIPKRDSVDLQVTGESAMIHAKPAKAHSEILLHSLNYGAINSNSDLMEKQNATVRPSSAFLEKVQGKALKASKSKIGTELMVLDAFYSEFASQNPSQSKCNHPSAVEAKPNVPKRSTKIVTTKKKISNKLPSTNKRKSKTSEKITTRKAIRKPANNLQSSSKSNEKSSSDNSSYESAENSTILKSKQIKLGRILKN